MAVRPALNATTSLARVVLIQSNGASKAPVHASEIAKKSSVTRTNRGKLKREGAVIGRIGAPTIVGTSTSVESSACVAVTLSPFFSNPPEFDLLP